jgi:hypothetical protein
VASKGRRAKGGLSKSRSVAKLANVIARLNRDETRVVLELAERLLEGQHAYGPLDLGNDTRNWRAEARSEVEDLLIYYAFLALMPRGNSRRQFARRGAS